mmetsp:Transcript_15692/g.54483  ORF Transcript_15692/g.54483 Transcript_15692/m.54483 type:complete len:231 (+) Transcript_15692:431-1123(+)
MATRRGKPSAAASSATAASASACTSERTRARTCRSPVVIAVVRSASARRATPPSARKAPACAASASMALLSTLAASREGEWRPSRGPWAPGGGSSDSVRLLMSSAPMATSASGQRETMPSSVSRGLSLEQGSGPASLSRMRRIAVVAATAARASPRSLAHPPPPSTNSIRSVSSPSSTNPPSLPLTAIVASASATSASSTALTSTPPLRPSFSSPADARMRKSTTDNSGS